ncbi:MAG TPA: non-homologous end-joining DNA ligase [Fibrobacteria bacterium]|nr:non-homologous end-joining DNA ligase [Fibrobacteria bacterium]
MSLRTYRQKRDFAKTREPRGGKAEKAGKRLFVVQKHAASHLHYDFRLEMGGTLKSWAVPKGIPLTRGEKRLAMQVEDHPLSYARFEGVIPKGQYGGGTVMVWDIGTFEPLDEHPLKNLAAGKLRFVLAGRKLRGEWHLVRMRGKEEGDKQPWLLLRSGSNAKPLSARAEDSSALSGRGMKAIASSGDAVWKSGREERKNPKGAGRPKDAGDAEEAPPPPRRKPSKKTDPPKVRKVPLPFFDPMKAKLTLTPPTGGDWRYEIKFDGFRALAFRDRNGVRLLSRNDKDLSGKFPTVAASVAKLKTHDTVLDGEIVAMDPKGRSSFQLLQAYELGQERPPLLYNVFDLPFEEGRDLRTLPLEERQARLAKLLRRPPGILRPSAVLEGEADALLAQARELGLEGLIGKRAGSEYEAGRRSGAWIKLKTHREQEFVVGGYTDPEGGRSSFGALLVGVHEKKTLRFCGKVGTGFTGALLKSLHARMKKLARKDCPFVNLPEPRAGRYGAGVTVSEMRRCHWLKPELVAQVKFSEWTRDGKLRQPVFLGLREDKDASDVVREEPA